MSRLAGVILALVAASGCAGIVPPVAYELRGGETLALPDDGRIASLVTAAGEMDWRRATDLGPVKFDDGGLPVVTPESTLAAARSKPRHFGLRIGGTPDVHPIDSGMDNFDYYEDGPLGGFYFCLGPRGGRIALEFGADIATIRADSEMFGYGIESQQVLGRADGVLYLKKAGAVKLLTFFGFRSVQEQIEIFDEYSGYVYETRTEMSDGWASGIGIATARFDLRFEHSESGGENRMGYERVIAALRF